MPSLIPGMPGTKEAYGISLLRDNGSIIIPPKAFGRYKLTDNDTVLLTSTHIGEGGLSIINLEMAYKSIFKNAIDRIKMPDIAMWNNNRAYALTKIFQNKVVLNDVLIQTFNLKKGDKLMVIKSTTMAMSFTPIEIWEKKFKDRDLYEAIENMKQLVIY